MAIYYSKEAMLAKIEKYAGNNPSTVSKIEKILDEIDINKVTLGDLLAVPGMGRKTALVIMNIACDIAGKK